jgi:RNA polymerase sigma factor (sigma-70 family)
MDEELSNKQLLTKALNFLKLLTPNERAVFILRDVNNLSTKEIAKILSCTQITVRRHSNNARKKLKKFLQSNKTIFF